MEIPSNSNEELALVGVIVFSGTGGTRTSLSLAHSVEKNNQSAAEPSTDGHYIAYISMDNLENKSTWEVYDDLKDRAYTVKGNYEVSPRLIMYIKVKKST